MRRYPLLLVFTLLVSSLYAQQKPSIELDLDKMFPKKQAAGQSHTYPGSNTSAKKEELRKRLGKALAFSHRTIGGNVYILPQDNMPMYKPTTGNQNMPVLVLQDPNPVMPGTQPRKPLFFPSEEWPGALPSGPSLQKSSGFPAR